MVICGMEVLEDPDLPEGFVRIVGADGNAVVFQVKEGEADAAY